jgi:hypothetical protein
VHEPTAHTPETTKTTRSILRRPTSLLALHFFFHYI